ncbi:hypothetical protein [Massilia sp. YIM B04103]|uniref:tetratricopeptide repeat protein n=1 Tax=Massilia sp. YIM B04103 TaxID=2963106 RepID=UPI0021098536|nr:hypothetical protein [Massilia sp. YIM B04103]
MANREELGIIRGARAGDPSCQLALGRLYLFGGASLPMSMPTALHWLSRAAQQGQEEAWRLIGQHISFEYAQHGGEAVLEWYERASDAGLLPAAVVLAQLVQQTATASAALRGKAWRALQAAAQAGMPQAQRLLAGWPGMAPAAPRSEASPVRTPVAGASTVAAASAGNPPQRSDSAPASLADAARAANAINAQLEQAWQDLPRRGFLAQAQALARTLAQQAPQDLEAARAAGWQLETPQSQLFARCAQALSELADSGAALDAAGEADLQRFRELAAHGGDRNAQLALGLSFARMNCEGDRMPRGNGAVNFKRAIRWLTQAGEQGLAEAWFALSRIYNKPEFSQRSLLEAQACLERAADMGHSGAQLECGIHAWRTRRGGEQNDVRAAYWLQKAASQGSAEAQAALERIAPAGPPESWASTLLPLLTRELLSSQPLLAARIELASLFQLSRAEALLLDVKAADQGHCLVIDIRASYGRSKRRLVLIRSAQQRQALDRIQRQFEQIDCSLAGPEGNYRQRLYRFKTWLISVAGGDLLAA